MKNKTLKSNIRAINKNLTESTEVMKVDGSPHHSSMRVKRRPPQACRDLEVLVSTAVNRQSALGLDIFCVPTGRMLTAILHLSTLN